MENYGWGGGGLGLLRGTWNYARCALNEVCSKSPYLIIEFLAGTYYIVFRASTYQSD
jgi:hypothetical protein